MTVADKISEILQESLNPTHLDVINESDLHAGHGGDDGSGESHFRIILVSEQFKNLPRIECHRMVYDLLMSNLQKMPHALSIKAKSVG